PPRHYQPGDCDSCHIDGNNIDGDNIDGDNVDGDNVDGDNVDGDNVDGDNVDGGMQMPRFEVPRSVTCNLASATLAKLSRAIDDDINYNDSAARKNVFVGLCAYVSSWLSLAQFWGDCNY
ncbi:hypothetical protein E4U30_000248, partial [Claviceps sp. LM220 group G6]